ncbi:Imm45 family immunity protein [Eikenella corrodens]|uniref:Imm45 family immunity protein n=1 Tax=Eikenella corrodens TaxID=539 RepID=UPI001F001078|nr:Imm45 family immunity protein [Eikenella corrodens]
MKKLIDYQGDLKRGMVLRLPGAYPHEEYVDLMLVELPGGDRRFGLLVATGHKVWKSTALFTLLAFA